MACRSSTATRNLSRSWAETTSAHADLANDSRSAASKPAAFDGVNRHHYFQRLTNETCPLTNGQVFLFVPASNVIGKPLSEESKQPRVVAASRLLLNKKIWVQRFLLAAPRLHTVISRRKDASMKHWCTRAVTFTIAVTTLGAASTLANPVPTEKDGKQVAMKGFTEKLNYLPLEQFLKENPGSERIDANQQIAMPLHKSYWTGKKPDRWTAHLFYHGAGPVYQRTCVHEYEVMTKDAAMAMRQKLIDVFGEPNVGGKRTGGDMWRRETAPHMVSFSAKPLPDGQYEVKTIVADHKLVRETYEAIKERKDKK